MPRHRKILDLNDLAVEVGRLKAAGKRVVQCHGVFDLLHVGHIRHFQEARAFGDVLLVTLTRDEHVNKGPHRPAFPQELRAESIAALDAVDYVAINRWPDAVETIRLLKPDFYVKGPDYKDAGADVTGGIAAEADAVASVGGQIRFTDDITFSSSSLLNRHMPAFSGEVSEFLTAFRARYQAGDIRQYIERLRPLRPLVVGEAIVDEYVYCSAMGKSAKEPILAMRYERVERYAGGTLAIANHLADFCDTVDLVTYLGCADAQEEFVRAHLRPNVRPHFIYKSDSPTIVKRRFVESYLLSKVFEVYEMNDELLTDAETAACVAAIGGVLPSADVVIAADFGHGMLTPPIVEQLCGQARFLAVNTQTNAANVGFHAISKYPRADYICMQENEIRLDSRSRKGDLEPLVIALAKRLSCPTVMVTRGRTGTFFYRDGEGVFECPAFAMSVVDRVGAGDSVLAVTSLCAAAGVPADAIGFIANVVGAQAVTILGNSRSIDRIQVLKSIESLLK